jgi:CrcB protein
MELIVFTGAGLGGVARYLLGGWIQEAWGSSFPWGTFVINITGSIALGVIYQYLQGTPPRPEWRAFWGIGFFGGYTTFSTFSFETAKLIQGGQWPRAGAYVVGSTLLALVGIFVGFYAADAMLRRG